MVLSEGSVESDVEQSGGEVTRACCSRQPCRGEGGGYNVPRRN